MVCAWLRLLRRETRADKRLSWSIILCAVILGARLVATVV